MTGAEFGGVDIDLLADYIGGALEGTADESVVAARIADDPAWRAAYESLSGGMALVGAELGRLEAEPMPAELASRLDEAFRSTPHLAVVDGGAPAVRRTQRERRTRRMRWATPIAIAAGVVAFVGFGLDYLAGRDSSDSQVAATGSVADAGSAPAERAAAAQISASGTDYTRATLRLPPPQPLVAPRGTSAAKEQGQQDTRAAGSAPALSRLADPAALADCLAAIERENAGGTIAVETVDYASFEGSPAVVVHFTAANGAWAWAAGADCGTPAAGADTLDKVPVR